MAIKIDFRKILALITAILLLINIPLFSFVEGYAESMRRTNPAVMALELVGATIGGTFVAPEVLTVLAVTAGITGVILIDKKVQQMTEALYRDLLATAPFAIADLIQQGAAYKNTGKMVVTPPIEKALQNEKAKADPGEIVVPQEVVEKRIVPTYEEMGYNEYISTQIKLDGTQSITISTSEVEQIMTAVNAGKTAIYNRSAYIQYVNYSNQIVKLDFFCTNAYSSPSYASGDYRCVGSTSGEALVISMMAFKKIDGVLKYSTDLTNWYTFNYAINGLIAYLKADKDWAIATKDIEFGDSVCIPETRSKGVDYDTAPPILIPADRTLDLSGLGGKVGGVPVATGENPYAISGTGEITMPGVITTPIPTAVPTTSATPYEGIKMGDLTEPGEIDFGPLKVAGTMFTNKFPFSLPWDLWRSFSSLAVAPQAPDFNIVVPDTKYMKGMRFNANLDIFSGLLQVVRAIELVLFDIGLVLITGKLLGGDK